MVGNLMSMSSRLISQKVLNRRADQRSSKTMELRIPLLNIENKTPENISTQNLQTLTEEVLEEGTIDTVEPSLYEEISPEVIDRIIAELRGDPGLKDIMTNLEEEIEQEQIGMEVDVEVDDRLETEMENLLW